MPEYYIARQGRTYGPYSVAQMRLTGLSWDTLVFTEGLGQWTQAAPIAELQAVICGGAPAALEPPPVPEEVAPAPTQSAPTEDMTEQYVPAIEPSAHAEEPMDGG